MMTVPAEAGRIAAVGRRTAPLGNSGCPAEFELAQLCVCPLGARLLGLGGLRLRGVCEMCEHTS